eukprot:scaffold7675_cov277-Pinguiococcus_pyrenoidosus.AAC.3
MHAKHGTLSLMSSLQMPCNCSFDVYSLLCCHADAQTHSFDLCDGSSSPDGMRVSTERAPSLSRFGRDGWLWWDSGGIQSPGILLLRQRAPGSSRSPPPCPHLLQDLRNNATRPSQRTRPCSRR